MATTEERAEALQSLAPSLAALDADAQKEAIKAAINGPDAPTTNLLWKILIPGLLGLVAIALLGVIFLLAFDKSADPAVTAFTALLTGLIGFFAPSPIANKENNTPAG